LKIQLPKASDSQSTKAKQPIKLAIDARGHFFLNAREISSTKSDALSFALKRVMSGADRPIVIQSDAESPVQSLVTAMDVVGKLGLSHVSIATTRPIE
jgi:biopolymer transport protein ExbD